MSFCWYVGSSVLLCREKYITGLRGDAFSASWFDYFECTKQTSMPYITGHHHHGRRDVSPSKRNKLITECMCIIDRRTGAKTKTKKVSSRRPAKYVREDRSRPDFLLMIINSNPVEKSRALHSPLRETTRTTVRSNFASLNSPL